MKWSAEHVWLDKLHIYYFYHGVSCMQVAHGTCTWRRWLASCWAESLATERINRFCEADFSSLKVDMRWLVDSSVHKKSQCRKRQQVKEKAITILWSWKAVRRHSSVSPVPKPTSNTRIRQLLVPLAAKRGFKKIVACPAGCLFCLRLAFLSCPSRGMACRSMTRNGYARSNISPKYVYTWTSHTYRAFPAAPSLFVSLLWPVYFLLFLSFRSCSAIFLTFIQLSYRSIRSLLVVCRT